jgi:hypothetical protein
MIQTKIQRYEMLTRVADFAARNVSLFPKKTAAVELTKDIQSAVARLSQSKVAQTTARDQLRTSRSQRMAKQAALRSQVVAIHETAGALKMTGFSLPAKRGTSALFDAARSYATAVATLKSQFVWHGLPSAFTDNLESATEDLQVAIDAQVAARAQLKAAIQDFDKTLDEAQGYLERFEALLSNAMSDNHTVIAAWEVARRLDRPRSSRKEKPDPVAPTPPASAAVSGTAA